MGGIAGCIVTAPAPWIARVVSAMGGSIAHRGPDDHGILLWDRQGPVHCGRDLPAEGANAVGLAHRRLSIIDLSKAGWQPMSSDNGRYHIVYNGEIYDYVELREELLKRGHRFRGESDTEVLLAACAEWGSGALPRLVGMFAKRRDDPPLGECRHSGAPHRRDPLAMVECHPLDKGLQC